MVGVSGQGYRLTELGKAQAEQIWKIAEAHAKETFNQFSDEEVDTFNHVLRKLLCQ